MISAPPLAPAGGSDASPALSLIPCPACALPAEIIDQFTLASTDGPVDHLAIACIADHFFRMAADRLSAGTRALLPAGSRGRRGSDR